MEGDIGVCGIAVLVNFSCSILVILILNCSITVFSKPAGCVFLTLMIVGIKMCPSLFPTIYSCFWLFCHIFVTHFNLQFDCFNNQFKASLFSQSHCLRWRIQGRARAPTSSFWKQRIFFEEPELSLQKFSIGLFQKKSTPPRRMGFWKFSREGW